MKQLTAQRPDEGKSALEATPPAVDITMEHTAPPPPGAYLLAVVEVDPDARILCQAEGCGHSVFKRIHVVLEGTEFKVFGSQCYQRLFGHLGKAAMTPQYGSSEGRRLTADEQLTLAENTARFIELLENERLEFERKAALAAAAAAAENERREKALLQSEPLHYDVKPKIPPPPAEQEVSPEDMCFHGKAGMHWMWSRSHAQAESRIAAYRQGAEPSAVVELVLKYALRPSRGDPWLTAINIERNHGVAQFLTLKTLYALALIEPMPGYSAPPA